MARHGEQQNAGPNSMRGVRKLRLMSKVEAAHWTRCKNRSACLECKFTRLSPRWKKQLQIDVDNPSLGSWLCCRRGKQGFSLRCAACAVVGHTTMAATCGWDSPMNAQLCHFQRHMSSGQHVGAIAKLLGRKIKKPKGVPSKKAFKLVFDSVRKSEATRNGVDHVGKGRKVTQMKFCLAEACRDADRAFLRRAKSIALHADSKGKRFDLG